MFSSISSKLLVSVLSSVYSKRGLGRFEKRSSFVGLLPQCGHHQYTHKFIAFY